MLFSLVTLFYFQQVTVVEQLSCCCISWRDWSLIKVFSSLLRFLLGQQHKCCLVLRKVRKTKLSFKFFFYLLHVNRRVQWKRAGTRRQRWSGPRRSTGAGPPRHPARTASAQDLTLVGKTNITFLDFNTQPQPSDQTFHRNGFYTALSCIRRDFYWWTTSTHPLHLNNGKRLMNCNKKYHFHCK